MKMAELTRHAGLAPPEIEAGTDEVIVRFRPSGYLPPERIGHDLSNLQRQLLQVLADSGPSPLSNVMSALPPGVARRTVQANLRLLQQLGLVDQRGERRWARWMLADEPDSES